ncbi:MAG: DUF4349 domain-containing protein [Chloroflexi bacterium]|nr:DUF4349 domain-containing protein [Chloroflexota bacterium]
MKKALSLIFVLTAAFIFAACASAPMSAEPPYRGAAPAEAFESAPQAPAQPVSDQPVTSNKGEGAAAGAERIVVQNAELTIVVADVAARLEEIQTMARQMGGFVVSSALRQSYVRDGFQAPEAEVVIRVPAEELDAALERIKENTVEVRNETRSGQDVTAEYVDLQSRLKNYEAAEAQLEKILENATETEDVVSIFNQLVYYREQIELVKGQMKFYEEAAALSAVTVRILAEETIQPLVVGKWEPKGVALEAIQDLIDYLQGFVDFLIRFTLFVLPVLITICGPIYLVFLGGRYVYRKTRGNTPKKEEPPAEKKNP